MMARRPRPADPAAAHEETNMWNSILVDLKKARDLNIKSKEIIKQAVEVESTMGKCTSFHVSHLFIRYPIRRSSTTTPTSKP